MDDILKMRITLLLLSLVALGQAASLSDLLLSEWRAYKSEFNKNYDSVEEERFRLKIFADNKYFIAQHNELFESGMSSYKMGLNQFSDMLHSEFVDTMLGYATQNITEDDNALTYIEPAFVTIPDSLDWRARGAVTSVKNQGACGSCWAFSSTGALEAQHFLQTRQLISLSEQNLVDCSSRYGNKGCNGGWMGAAFDYIRDNRGIDTEQSYPYEGKVNRCRFNRRNVGATLKGYMRTIPGNEQQLLSAVATRGPFAVAIDASQRSFQHYHSGVYNEPKCSTARLNHAVVVIGFGHEGGGDYWLVKNSWSIIWGDAGYIKMSRNRGNQCGIATAALLPSV